MSNTGKEAVLETEVSLAEPVEILGDEVDIEVSVVDDTPEGDRNRPARVDGADEDGDLDESQFGKRIRKRIDKLRYEWNEERRAKEGALRENQEAVHYAQNVQGENQSLKQQLSDQRRLLYDQVSAKTDAEISGAKQRYKEAYEPQQSVPPPDPLAVDWLKRNTWFQQPGYEEVTGFAIGLHEKLVKQGVDPRGNPQYYEQIDAVLSQQFSERGKENEAGEAPTSRRTPVVAPAKRGGKTPRKVELNQSQVKLARKLGLSPEQYAQQLVKEMSGG